MPRAQTLILFFSSSFHSYFLPNRFFFWYAKSWYHRYLSNKTGIWLNENFFRPSSIGGFGFPLLVSTEEPARKCGPRFVSVRFFGVCVRNSRFSFLSLLRVRFRSRSSVSRSSDQRTRLTIRRCCIYIPCSPGKKLCAQTAFLSCLRFMRLLKWTAVFPDGEAESPLFLLASSRR